MTATCCPADRKTTRWPGLSGSQMEVRQQVEQYLEDKAQTMLDGVLGPGKSIVRVTAELNFQQLERTSEMYDPNASRRFEAKNDTKATMHTTDKAQPTVTGSSPERTPRPMSRITNSTRRSSTSSTPWGRSSVCRWR